MNAVSGGFKVEENYAEIFMQNEIDSGMMVVCRMDVKYKLNQ